MTRARIAELRRAETVMLREEINITRAEWLELLDAAEAWELLRQRRIWVNGWAEDEVKWFCTRDAILHLSSLGHDLNTPQAAVLAALRPKGAKT